MRQVQQHTVENVIFRDLIERKLERLPNWVPLTETSAEVPRTEPGSRITRMIEQVLPCPVCKRSGKHSTRYYEGYEINTCLIDPEEDHSWRVDYSIIGNEELYRTIMERLVRAYGLVNELQGILTKAGYAWGKRLKARDSQQVERLSVLVDHLMRLFRQEGLDADQLAPIDIERVMLLLDPSPIGFPDLEQEEPEEPKRARGKRSSGNPEDFKRQLQCGVLQGLYWAESLEQAKWKSKLLRRDFTINARMVVVSPSLDFSEERYLIMVPEGVDPETRDLMLYWLANGTDEEAIPITGTGSAKGDRTAESYTFSQNGQNYRGVFFSSDGGTAKQMARMVKEQFGLSVRSRPAKDGYVVMVPAEVDTESMRIIKMWAEQVSPQVAV